ncbi:MAG: sulfatase-like hydrolase/transferase, partial [Bacteroidota bacterium]
AIPNPNFYGMIANFDDNLGRLRKMLQAEGLEEDTIIIFLTDNGSSAGAKLDGQGNVTKGYNAGMRGMKVSQYEGGHRVPLFIKFPERTGIVPSVHHELTAYTDILPTLVELVGGEVNVDYPLDGISLLPLLQEGKQEELTDRYVVVDTQRDDLPLKGKRSCVMQGAWRLVDGKFLYNLANDPGQRENLIEGEATRAAAMQEAYESWWSRLEGDIALTNRIIVGHPAENPSLLTSHDWHTEKDPPWNQKQIRAGKVDNGYWALDLAEAGSYSFKLYRWPPEIMTSLGAAVPAGGPIPGGKPYAEGVSLPSVSIKLKIGDTVIESEGADKEIYRLTAVEDLPAGPIELQTWITDAEGVTRGAYYVEVERME